MVGLCYRTIVGYSNAVNNDEEGMQLYLFLFVESGWFPLAADLPLHRARHHRYW